MDIIKSIKSWKPRSGFQRKTKSLQHGQQHQNLKTIRRMNDAENEFMNNDEPILNNRLLEVSNGVQAEYWGNESCSSNASTTHIPMKEELSSGSVSSVITNRSSRTTTKLPSTNQTISIFQDNNDAGKGIFTIRENRNERSRNLSVSMQ